MVKVFSNPEFKDTNAFLIYADKKNSVLVDTACGMHNEINKFIKDNDITLTDILVTHTHFDHILGINEIYDANNSPTVRVGSEELLGFFDPQKNLSILYSVKFSIWTAKPIKNLKILKPNDRLQIGENDIEILSSKGHSPGMLMFDFKNINSLFTGDSLFLKFESVLFDVLGASNSKSKETVNYILDNYDKEYKIFPGHYHVDFTIEEMTTNNKARKRIKSS